MTKQAFKMIILEYEGAIIANIPPKKAASLMRKFLVTPLIGYWDGQKEISYCIFANLDYLKDSGYIPKTEQYVIKFKNGVFQLINLQTNTVTATSEEIEFDVGVGNHSEAYLEDGIVSFRINF